jgi:hypothetical protein
MKCVESSDAADDIYVITFRGNTTSPFDSNVSVKGPGNIWTDFDAGEEEGADQPIAMFRPDAVYVVMLVEQDSGKDVAGEKSLGTWRSITNLAWKASLVGSAVGGTPASSEPAMAPGRRHRWAAKADHFSRAKAMVGL